MFPETALPIGVVLLTYVTAQRLLELFFARRNTHRLLDKGAFEVGARHYGYIVAVHAAWLTALWTFVPGQPVYVLPFALFVVVQLLRAWTLLSIGRRWTTRIIVMPGEELVAKGPYRFVSHPNYIIVVCEIFLLPSVFGLWAIAIIFSLLNAGVLMIRIPIETAALRQHRKQIPSLPKGPEGRVPENRPSV